MWGFVRMNGSDSYEILGRWAKCYGRGSYFLSEYLISSRHPNSSSISLTKSVVAHGEEALS